MARTSSSKRKRSRTHASSSRAKASTATKRLNQNRTNKRQPSNKRTSNLKMRRPSGRLEPYDKEKLAQTLSKWGTPFVMAKDIAKTVSSKIVGDAEESSELLLQNNSDNSLTENLGTRGIDNSKKVALNNKQGTKEIDANRLRELVARELELRNRQDIALSYRGERPENIRPRGPAK